MNSKWLIIWFPYGSYHFVDVTLIDIRLEQVYQLRALWYVFFLNIFCVYLSAKKLAEELDGWLKASSLSKSSDVRGVIAP